MKIAGVPLGAEPGPITDWNGQIVAYWVIGHPVRHRPTTLPETGLEGLIAELEDLIVKLKREL